MPFYERVETLSPESRFQEQLTSLQGTVKHAYENVPFYRTQLDEAGVKPSDIQSLEDIAKLPFTRKHHLRDHYPFGLLAVPMDQVIRLHGSSGTSGKPTIVAYTEKDLNQWSDIIARSIYMAGGRKGDLLHNSYGYGLFTGGLGLHDGSQKLGCTTVPISGGNTQRQITLIQDFKPKILCGTPSYIMNIGETMIKMGIDPAETSIEYAILGSEPWSEEMRHSLEDMYQMKAMDIYGLSEVIGPGVAMECVEGQQGLHIAEDHFFPEIIDPDTLQPLPDGEEGELVFTSLQKEALPVLRYRTGDISSLTREKCVCGRTTVRMSRIKGRIDDMIIVRGVNVFPSEIERCILQNEELECHYHIYLDKHGSMDKVSLEVELGKNVHENLSPSLDCDKASAIKKKVQQKLKDEALISMEVQLKAPGSMPRYEGKAKRVHDKRDVMKDKSPI
jgi:phenylacetate-CoA ligase